MDLKKKARICAKLVQHGYWNDRNDDLWDDLGKKVRQLCAPKANGIGNDVQRAIATVGERRLWVALATLDTAFCKAVAIELETAPFPWGTNIKLKEKTAKARLQQAKSLAGALDVIDAVHTELREDGALGFVCGQESEWHLTCPICGTETEGAGSVSCASSSCDYSEPDRDDECPLCVATEHIEAAIQHLDTDAVRTAKSKSFLLHGRKFFARNAIDMRARCWGWVDERLRDEKWSGYDIANLVSRSTADFNNPPCEDFASGNHAKPLERRLDDLRYRRRQYVEKKLPDMMARRENIDE